MTRTSKSTLFRLILIAVVLQVGVFAYNTYQEKTSKPQQYDGTLFAIHSGDTPSYTDPIDNFLANGTYEVHSEEAGYSHFGRTPYYGFFYGFFRLFLDKPAAEDCLVIFQLILKIISSVLLFYLSLMLTDKKSVAWIAFLCFCTLSWASMYTPRVLTESTTMSFAMIGLYYFFLWKKKGIGRHFWIAAFLFGYAGCMRPFLFPGLAVFGMMNILFTPEFSLKTKVTRAALLVVPIVLLLLPWTIRNYRVSGKPIVLQEDVNAGYHYTLSDLSLRYFLTATGESFIAWDYKAAGSWYDPNLSKFSTYEISPSILGESVTREKLDSARFYFMRKSLTGSASDDSIADSLFVVMREGFIKEKPFYYYVISPLKITWSAYGHDGVDLLQRRTWYELGYKAAQSVLFVLISLGFVAALVFRTFREGKYLWLIPVMMAVVLCFGFRFCEKRYFIYAYPVFILYAATVFDLVLRRFKVIK